VTGGQAGALGIWGCRYATRGSITSSPCRPRRRNTPLRANTNAELDATSVCAHAAGGCEQATSEMRTSGVSRREWKSSIAVQAGEPLCDDGTHMPWRTLALLLAGQMMASMDSSILTV